MENSMSPSLDALASNGVVNFDANAFLKGTTPRYYGSPNEGQVYLPGDQPLFNSPEIPAYGIAGGENLKGQPNKDAFLAREHEKGEINVSTKNIITAGIVGALALFAGSKFKKTQLGQKLISKFSKANIAETASGILGKAQSALSGVTGKTKPAASAAAETVEKVAEVAKTKKKFSLANIPKPVKIGGLAVAGALGLYEVYRMITDRKGPVQEG